MAQPICVVTGVGPGTGTALARRFANGGYRVAMLARSAQRRRARCPTPVPTPAMCPIRARWRPPSMRSNATWARHRC